MSLNTHLNRMGSSADLGAKLRYVSVRKEETPIQLTSTAAVSLYLPCSRSMCADTDCLNAMTSSPLQHYGNSCWRFLLCQSQHGRIRLGHHGNLRRGVTIFAFGNGSSGLFSTFAAIGPGSGSLAIGKLCGAASLIIAVAVRSTSITYPFNVVLETFVRDGSFFIIAASPTPFFIPNNSLAMWGCVFIMSSTSLRYLCNSLALVWRPTTQSVARSDQAIGKQLSNAEQEIERCLDEPIHQVFENIVMKSKFTTRGQIVLAEGYWCI